MERVMPTMRGAHFTDNKDNIVIAADGTVKNGRGSGILASHDVDTWFNSICLAC